MLLVNALELLAIEYALKSFSKETQGQHVKVLCDSTCAVDYVKKMGVSHSEVCNIIAKGIWIWCKDKGIEQTINFLPGKQNVEANKKSRQFYERTEWMLNHAVFSETLKLCYVHRLIYLPQF